LFHWRRSAIIGRPGKLAGSCRSSSDVERANANYYEIVSQPAPATNIASHDANWEDYEDLLDPLGEADGSPISDNEAELQVLTQISTGENQLIFEGFYLDRCVREVSSAQRRPEGGGARLHEARDEETKPVPTIFHMVARTIRLADRFHGLAIPDLRGR
jgi:hypothetical protein